MFRWSANALAGAMTGRLPPDVPIIPSGYTIVPADDPKRLIPRGVPVARLSEESVDGVGPDLKEIWLNQLTFKTDPDGTGCPYGAHVRRANPRSADLPLGTHGPVARLMRTLGFASRHPHDDLVASTRFHRILRRGREYIAEPGRGSAETQHIEERGLRFVCLNANIARQFEFIQISWLANAKFNGLDEDDPLVGNRAKLMTGAAVDTFTRPQDSGLPCRVHGLPQFVKVNGGAYFFMPGIAALRYIARCLRESACAGGPENTSLPFGSMCGVPFMVWRSRRNSQYMRRRARLWLPSGRCSAMQCHGV